MRRPEIRARPNARWPAVLAACLVALLTATPALGQSAPAKFQTAAENGIANTWLVMLTPAEEDVAVIATRLAESYGGHIGELYRDAGQGYFAIMPAEVAETLSQDPAVAYVAQHQAVGGNRKFQPASRDGIPGEWMVGFAPEARGSNAEIGARLAQRYGGTVIRAEWYFSRWFSVSMPTEAALALSRDAEVAWVVQNQTVHLIEPKPPADPAPPVPDPPAAAPVDRTAVLATLRAANHSCSRPTARGRRVPRCVTEVAARAQRLLGESRPIMRSWVRTTYGRAGIAAKARLRAKPVLVIRLVGSLGEARIQLDPVTRRVVGRRWIGAEAPASPPALGTLGRSHRF